MMFFIVSCVPMRMDEGGNSKTTQIHVCESLLPVLGTTHDCNVCLFVDMRYRVLSSFMIRHMKMCTLLKKVEIA